MSANADVWRWVDANGDTHYVDSDRPIYTWVDEYGKIHYSDKPSHADAISVEPVWHSTGAIADFAPEKEQGSGDSFAYEGETEADRAQRQQAEAYYCKRATEIYESYLKAPKLYKTDDAGERIYLSEDESAQILSHTKSKVDELCN